MTQKQKKQITRKEMLKAVLTTAAASALPVAATANQPMTPEPAPDTATDTALTLDDLKAAEKVAGLTFTDAERTQMLESVRQLPATFAELRKQTPDGLPAPPTPFVPIGGGSIHNARVQAKPSSVGKLSIEKMSDEDIAFLSVCELSHLLHTRQITSARLTHIYLDRLKRYGDKLLCVVTLTEELALKQAAVADTELEAGKSRSALHGIPYGIKDLFATKGIPTEWGAAPYVGQIFDHDSAVVERLAAAGAVLCAKLSMGSLAMDDVWNKGMTKNPWNPQEGSSGSSAGSASATAAGLVAFAIGTETLGSIVSPSQRCRVTGLRPTFGRVSRYGAMELSSTMDKVGPICRAAEDCALVLAALCGADPRDPASVSRPFLYSAKNILPRLRIGFLVAHDDKTPFSEHIARIPALHFLQAQGAELRPLILTPLPAPCYTILDVESASAFDALTRSGRVNEVKNSLWPDFFRAARHVPAVEYLQAQRLRGVAMHRFEQELGDLDLFVTVSPGMDALGLTNMCGHPEIVIPQGTYMGKPDGAESDKADAGKAESDKSKAPVPDRVLPSSVSFIGRLYREDVILAVARSVQNQTEFHRLRPDLSHFSG